MAETLDPAARHPAFVTNEPRSMAERFELERGTRLRSRIRPITIALLVATAPLIAAMQPLGFGTYRVGAAVFLPCAALLFSLVLYHRVPRTSLQSERSSTLVYTLSISGIALGVLSTAPLPAIWPTIVGLAAMSVILPLGIGLSVRAAAIVLSVPWSIIAAVGFVRSPSHLFVAALITVCVLPYTLTLFATRSRERLLWAEFAARDRLSESNRRLRDAEAARSRLFANLGHDFRTPLAVITGETGLLERRLVNADDREALRQIGINAIALSDLTNQLLELARLDAGQTPHRPTDCDAVAIARESVAQLDNGHRIASVTVRDGSESVLAHVDASHLRRILSSLVVHALRHARAGVGSVEIAVGTDGDRVTIDVTDDGPSLSVNERLTMFERFDGQDRDGSPASGIGAPLARELALINGGTLDLLASERTTFRLTLPAARGTRESVDESPRGHGARVIADEPRRRVLLVEDNEHMARLLARVLGDDYDVDCVRTVSESLAVLASSPPAAVLCEMKLPDGTGYDVLAAARVRRDGDRLPVLLLSAHSAPVDRALGLARGADDCLEKPFVAVELRARLHNAIAHVEARRVALRQQRDDLLAELHDGVMASLTRAAILLDAGEKAEGSRETVARAREAIDEGLDESRAFLSLLEGTDEPIADAIADVRRSMSDDCSAARLALHFDADNDGSCAWLTPTEAHTFRRVAREATTNALKHAGAASVRCTIAIRAGALSIRVEDDGRGIGQSGSAGRGLAILGRRVARLGGASEFGPCAERGAFVAAHFPLSRGLPFLRALPDSENIRTHSHERAIGTLTVPRDHRDA